MKNLLIALTFIFSILAYSNSNAQTTVIVCGNIIGTNGVPVNVYVVDSSTAISYTIVSDSSGNYCDTLSVPGSQGFISIGIYDCNGTFVSQYVSYSPFINQFTFTFLYCNSIPPNNFVVCVTVDNLPGVGTTVSVIIYSSNNQPIDTLLFNGAGTMTLCDTVAAAGGGLSALVSMVDCNGNLISATATINPGTITANVTLNYCLPFTPVTVCGNVSGNNGMAITVNLIDSLSGQTFSIVTDTSGYFCDTLNIAGQGLLIGYIMNCNGIANYQTSIYNSSSPNYNFNFNYCNTSPNYVVLCVTVDNLPGINTMVPVIVYQTPGAAGDTLYFIGQGSLTICDTILSNGSGLILLSMVDCNGNIVTATAQYSPFLTVVNVTINYCTTTPPCYAFWTSTYDTTNNTFYITVDSVTMAQAQTYFWDFGDSTFSTLPNPVHQYAANGIYNVCLTINASGGSAGCTYCHMIGITPNGGIITRDQGFKVVVLPQSATGISEHDISSFTFYPNPVNHIINIESLHTLKDFEVKLFSINGKELSTTNYSNTKAFQMDVRDLDSGVYIIQLISDMDAEVIKFMKK